MAILIGSLKSIDNLKKKSTTSNKEMQSEDLSNSNVL